MTREGKVWLSNWRGVREGSWEEAVVKLIWEGASSAVTGESGSNRDAQGT